MAINDPLSQSGGASGTFNPASGAQQSTDPKDQPAKPMMETVRKGVNKVGEIAGDIGELATKPAARPVVGGLMGLMAFVLAWRYAPTALSGMGLDSQGFGGKAFRGILSFGIAVALGMGLFELGNNGFNLKNTFNTYGKDGGIIWDMTKNGAKSTWDTVTGSDEPKPGDGGGVPPVFLPHQ